MAKKSGKGLGVLALIFSIGALSLGVYQVIAPQASEGPQIYSFLS